jgi:hypothetical protein
MVLYFFAAMPLRELCEEKIREANLIARFAHKLTHAELPEGQRRREKHNKTPV